MSERTDVVELAQAVEALSAVAPDYPVVGVAPLGGGKINGAYEVVGADGVDPLVLKLYEPEDGWRLAKEFTLYRVLRDHGVTTTPEVLAGFPADESPFGRPCLVMTRLSGTTLGDLDAELSDDEAAECYRQMGEILARIHKIEQPAFGYLSPGVLDPQPTNLAYMSDILARRAGIYLERTGDRRTYDAALRYLAEREDLLTSCQSPVLVHNDFHEGNIIAERTADGPVVTGFIDVENAIAGDPFTDLARTGRWCLRRPEVKMPALFAGYGAVPERWEERERLYRFVHDFEVWAWAGDVGWLEHQAESLADIREIVASS